MPHRMSIVPIPTLCHGPFLSFNHHFFTIAPYLYYICIQYPSLHRINIFSTVHITLIRCCQTFHFQCHRYPPRCSTTDLTLLYPASLAAAYSSNCVQTMQTIVCAVKLVWSSPLEDPPEDVKIRVIAVISFDHFHTCTVITRFGRR